MNCGPENSNGDCAKTGDEFTHPGGEMQSHTLPGIGPYSEPLQKKLAHMRKTRGAGYQPRTRHLLPDGSARYTNRLFLESSPYLLQHAHNPVNWYTWGDAAFAMAKKLNRPIFLSVGYSTCHWCHVMEEESFEDKEIARYLNENYIAIKVDREERPDLDAIYMAAVHAMGMQGGWPMNVWLTAQRQPFFGGTYFPPRDGDRGARMGFLSILKALKTAYINQPEQVAATSAQLAKTIEKNLTPPAGSAMPSPANMFLAARYYKNNYDSVFGGMKQTPKFPSQTPIRFLLRFSRRTGDEQLFTIAKHTLEKMAAGGMYDHIGGGFHRYSTDAQWLVPHFEKMLYDNALLAVDYLEAYQVTGNEDFKRITSEILRYVKREMTAPSGGFYSATDADSLTPNGHRDEGYYFTWTTEEMTQVLGEPRANTIAQYYALSKGGNFEGRNILHTPQHKDAFSKKINMQPEAFSRLLEDAKQLLYQSRQRRPAPARDEKILVAWNALMISAHAQAGRILNNKDYTHRAVKAAQLILDKLYLEGRLFRSYKDNMAKHTAYLDDYAFFIAALLDLYEASFDAKWLQRAIELDQILESHYEDPVNGGFFMTADDHEKLLAREKPNYDGAEPTGNSIAIMNLLRLGEFTTQDSYRRRAEKALQAFSTLLQSSPIALSKMLLAVDFYLDTAKEIIIVTPRGKKGDAENFLAALRKVFVPNKILAVAAEGEDLAAQEKVIPLVEAKTAMQGKVTAYVCEQGICQLPTHDPKQFTEQIKKIQKMDR